jgi:hypothetical protein
LRFSQALLMSLKITRKFCKLRKKKSMAITVKKVYPIKGRKDFFKYVVMDNGVIAKGFQGNKFGVEMYFNDKEDAERVAVARRKVRKLDKDFATGKTTRKK